MAIGIKLNRTDRILFCGSKWWGDPDMPENMEYPTIDDYPLTFVCQINCEEIAPYDPEGVLPHEGMLYFFAAIDEWIGYESPTENGTGEWPKGHFVVKYAKSINFETFRSCIMVDEDDQPLTEPELEMLFTNCDDNESGIKLLGKPSENEVATKYPDMLSLIQISDDQTAGISLPNKGTINLMIKPNDIGFGNWKRVKAYMLA